MKCPFCGEADSKVIDSRPAEDGSSIRRRRQCNACQKRFTTYEKVETIPLIVIKKDNNREPYDRQKIASGILCSCHKRRFRRIRSTSWLMRLKQKSLIGKSGRFPAQDIGEVVMNRLKDLDAVAYVRFASVYREFKDVNTFMDEIKKILK